MRESTMFRLLVLPLIAALAGCGGRMVEVSAPQPVNFSHKAHLEFFSSGRHKEAGFALHREALGEEELPEELVRGECATCHDLAAEKPQCAGCHTLFQDEKLRARKDVRTCAACHRKVWSGAEATIPSSNVCAPCHAEKALTALASEKRLRDLLAKGEDIPWSRLNTVGPTIHFSHSAHVRRAGMACTRCHEDMSQLIDAPKTVRVFSMEACLRCHEQARARTDCMVCHK